MIQLHSLDREQSNKSILHKASLSQQPMTMKHLKRNLELNTLIDSDQQAKKIGIDLDTFSKFITSPVQMRHDRFSQKSIKTPLPDINNSLSSYDDVHLSAAENKLTTPLDNINLKAGDNSKTILSKKDINSSNDNHDRSINQQSSIGMGNQTSSKESQQNSSYFFNGPRRFETNINANYFDHSTISPLVDSQQVSSFNSCRYSSVFNMQKKQFDANKLQLKSDSLMSPKERVRELIDVRDNKRLLNDWRNDYMEKNRSYKLVKAAFRSGISRLDGPMSESSKVYDQEHQQLVRKQQEEHTRKLARLRYIEKFVTTNPAIFFDNSQNTHLFDPHIKQSFPHQVDLFKNGFVEKRKNPQAILNNSDSFHKIFCDNLQDQKQNISSLRSKFLYSKDINGKSHNIVSNTLNPSIKYVQ